MPDLFSGLEHAAVYIWCQLKMEWYITLGGWILNEMNMVSYTVNLSVAEGFIAHNIYMPKQ